MIFYFDSQAKALAVLHGFIKEVAEDAQGRNRSGAES